MKEIWSAIGFVLFSFLSSAPGAGAAQEVAPANELSSGETLVVTLEESAALEGGEVLRRTLDYVCPADQQLYVWARSEDVDFRVEFRRIETDMYGEAEGVADGRHVLLVVYAMAGERCAFTVETGSPGGVELHLETTARTEEQLRATEAATAGLAECQKLRGEGELERARELRIATVDELVRVCGGGFPECCRVALTNLAREGFFYGDPSRRVEELERILMSIKRTFPPGSEEFGSLHLQLATGFTGLGHHGAAEQHLLAAMPILEESLPGTAQDLATARLDYAICLTRQGRFEEARPLLEQILRDRTPDSDRDHEDLIRAGSALANIFWKSGDLLTAQTMYEKLLADFERRPSPSPGHLLFLRENLANIRAQRGQAGNPEERLRETFETMVRLFGPKDPDTLTAKSNLARSLSGPDGHLRAIEMLEEVIEARLEVLPENHPVVQAERSTLANQLRSIGEDERALEIFRLLLQQREELLPPGNTLRLKSQWNVGSLLISLDRDDELFPIAKSWAEGLRCQARSALTLSRRGRAVAAQRGAMGIDQLIAMVILAETDALNAEIVELIDSYKILADTSPRVLDEAASDDPVLNALRERNQTTRRQVADLSAAAAARGATEEESAALRAAILARDEAERDYSAALVERGFWYFDEVSVERIAAGLPGNAAAVCYWRTSTARNTPREPDEIEGQGTLETFVIFPDGTLHYRRLFDVLELVAVAQEWRAAIGAPLTGNSRAVDSKREREAGERLRALILDPVLDAAESAEVLYVLPTDFLHLLPLEALPLGEGVVGDRLRIEYLNFLSELSHRRASSAAAPRLLVMGAIDYDAGGTEAEEPVEEGEPATTRGELIGGRFGKLEKTAEEIEAVAMRFGEKHGREAVCLSGAAATKETFLAVAPGARYLHLATHGAFVDEGHRSWASAKSVQASYTARTEDDVVIEGMAPLSLCGLAFAGANHAARSGAGHPGILTGEELAGLDLASCELAVLSACEGSLGLRNAGQALWSLQTALRSAGVRVTLTSLWEVDDEWTRQLMSAFYAELWGEQDVSPAEALRRAKRALRDLRRPTRDWAGWMLCGTSR